MINLSIWMRPSKSLLWKYALLDTYCKCFFVGVENDFDGLSWEILNKGTKWKFHKWARSTWGWKHYRIQILWNKIYICFRETLFISVGQHTLKQLFGFNGYISCHSAISNLNSLKYCMSSCMLSLWSKHNHWIVFHWFKNTDLLKYEPVCSHNSCLFSLGKAYDNSLSFKQVSCIRSKCLMNAPELYFP